MISVIIIVSVLFYVAQLAWVVISLIDDDIESKKVFWLSLIPFYPAIRYLIESYKNLG